MWTTKLFPQNCHSILSHTRDQIKSILWLNLHNGQITSSQFGSICHCRSTTDNTNIIRQLMGYQKMVGMPRQIRWGVEKESEARQCYIMTMTQQCKVAVSIAPSGLTLTPEHCYLGATSDGIITHTQSPSAGVLEIKCPVSVSGESVSELPPIEIAKYHPNFYLDSKDGAVQLKTTSNFYYQVQGEMPIKGCTWAHFVVWTAAKTDNIFIQEISLMSSYGLRKYYQLSFYLNALVPEILTRRLQKELFFYWHYCSGLNACLIWFHTIIIVQM